MKGEKELEEKLKKSTAFQYLMENYYEEDSQEDLCEYFKKIIPQRINAESKVAVSAKKLIQEYMDIEKIISTTDPKILEEVLENFWND